MKCSMSSFVKGMGAGVVAGIAVSATVAMVLKDNKRFKRKACRAMNTAKNLMENFSTILE